MSRLLVLGILLVVLQPVPAQAQTGEGCADFAVAARVVQGAFTGVVSGTRPEAGNTRTVVTFEVTQVFAGPLPGEGSLEVWFEDGRHGWTGETGELSILVTRDEGRWVSDPCLVAEATLLGEIGLERTPPGTLGENERETLKEPPLWIFFGIFGGGIGMALLVQRRRGR